MPAAGRERTTARYSTRRVTRGLEWWLVGAGLVMLVLARAYPLFAWSGAHFDSDQGVVGLMAKHIGEGRAFPLFFYGQSYMLAVEAWLAAPFIALAGTTVQALKLPLLLVNFASVLLLVREVASACRVRPLVAAIAVLPIAVPAAGVAARVLEANGGNAEPWLYVVLLWMLRDRPWAFGLLLGIAVTHREFTAAAAVALLAIDVVGGRLWSRARVQHWVTVTVCVVAVRTIVHALEPWASAFGPGTTGATSPLNVAGADAVAARVCLQPELWGTRLRLTLSEHLPQLFGAFPMPLSAFGVRTDVQVGQPLLVPAIIVLAVAGLAAAVWRVLQWWREPGRTILPDHLALGLYLLLVGAVSTAVFVFATCAPVSVTSLRYNLLGVMLAIGALVLLISARVRGLPVAIGMVMLAWTLANLRPMLDVTREYTVSEPADLRQIAADVLIAKGIRVAWGEFRLAYHLTFLADEQVRVAATDVNRIQEYVNAAHAAPTPTVALTPCISAQELAFGIYLCPPR